MIPVLLITYNRLEFTKQAFEGLLNSDIGPSNIFIIDNGSTDGTQKWLRIQPWARNVYYESDNHGIAHAMNRFLEATKDAEFVGKVDNDTIVPRRFAEKMLSHMRETDLLQAKHAITHATNAGGWEGFTANMRRKGNLLFNHFIGGSGIVFKRQLVHKIPDTAWKLGGWRQWQREHPKVLKAFADDVKIELLDTDENGAKYPSQYKDYYQQTGRI